MSVFAEIPHPKKSICRTFRTFCRSGSTNSFISPCIPCTSLSVSWLLPLQSIWCHGCIWNLLAQILTFAFVMQALLDLAFVSGQKFSSAHFFTLCTVASCLEKTRPFFRLIASTGSIFWLMLLHVDCWVTTNNWKLSTFYFHANPMTDNRLRISVRWIDHPIYI